MSLAWGSLVLLLVLLPGVLFFVGLYFPEKFTRDASERSALGQLAGVLLIAILVHGVLYNVSPLLCGKYLPCIDIRLFLRALTLDKPENSSLPAVADNIAENRGWILGYIALSSLFGTGLGWLTGTRVVAGGLSFLTQHRWAYRLSVGDELTTAWVLTGIQDGSRVLMYRGFLHAFHLKRDGTFSYVVLEHVRRGYLELGADGPSASRGGKWPAMGQSTRAAEKRALASSRRQYDETLFAIEGEDIANIVFDRYRVGFSLQIRDTAIDAAIRVALQNYDAIHKAARERIDQEREDHLEERPKD